MLISKNFITRNDFNNCFIAHCKIKTKHIVNYIVKQKTVAPVVRN